jgi:methylated-DNA-[protein]-cysteine S-methyltransferase
MGKIVATSVTRIDLETPVGGLALVFRDDVLCGVSFEDHWDSLDRWLARRFGEVKWAEGGAGGETTRSIVAYFGGELRALDAVEVDPGGSPFQREVWKALRTIGAGETRSYQELASAVGRPSASRAVARANATNPIPVVIPCHRVIHSDGSLAGYGGGIERKRWLLRHEAAGAEFRLKP